MELVKLAEQKICGELVQTVNARDLHEFLGSRQDFSTWIKKRVDDFGFVENMDFTRFHKKMEANNATMVEYHLSLDMAKELAMVERNEKGRQARQYFIECEKKLRESSKPKTTLEIIAAQTQVLIAQEREITRLKEVQAEQEDRIVRVEAKQNAFEEGFKYFTVLGYAAYKGITIDLTTAQSVGKKAAQLSRTKSVPIDKVSDPRFGRVNSYHESVLDEIVSDMFS